MGRRKFWVGEELERLERLLETRTQAEVAEIYNVSRSAIQMACNRNGLKVKRVQRIERPHGPDGKFVPIDNGSLIKCDCVLKDPFKKRPSVEGHRFPRGKEG